MRKVLVRVLPALLLLGVLLHVSFRAVQAQEGYTPQDAINFAAAHPAFASGLEARPGWTATAYTGNATFGIWHVEFWDAEGEALGWADLSLEHNLVYSWAADYGTTEQQNAEAEDAIRTFLSSNAEVMDLVGSLDGVNLYVEYAYWDQRWAAYIDLGPNSVYVTMRSASNPPMGLEDLELGYIYFPNI
ncbi:MAG: hypothetical protein KC547_13170, partial [Anaerolineae bacterium]|nr:hypothetical protein [Anaerolineae bacterium]